MKKQYLYTTERLGMRTWLDSDLEPMALLNQDSDVMEYFPIKPDRSQSKSFIERMQKMYAEKGYCYFAVDALDDNKFIGFIGIAYQDYDVSFAPFTDIGWRLQSSAWGQGFATEGARATLQYAFVDLRLTEIYALASEQNKKSEKVMQKIGMKKLDSFDHPKLLSYPDIKRCCLYRISSDHYKAELKK